MVSPSPEVAFHEWLRDSLSRALRAMRTDPARMEYLAQSVDHADLKRRLMVHELFR